MDKEGMIFNGYLRLYCAIRGITPPPKRCRVCGGEVDNHYGGRHCGFLCYECYKKQMEARLLGRISNPKVFTCEVLGCTEPGVRHHPDYNKPDEVRWLCLKHHNELHQGLNSYV